MKRWLALSICLAFTAGCSGMGSGASRFLPGTSSDNAFHPTIGSVETSDAQHPLTKVEVRMRIPRRHRGERTAVHPATISSATQSVTIAVNGGSSHVFNATPQSPNCSIGAGGTTCTFLLGVPAGNDSFVVSTYSGLSGTGSLLDRGTAVIAIAKGKANSPRITLGPVVSTNADSGMGSLRYAIGSANPGDTVMFTLPSGSTLALASPLTLNTSVAIAGPGVTTSIRMHHHSRYPALHSNLTFSGVTIDGGGAQQLFVIKPGVTVTISGLILAHGFATTPNQPGGAIYNGGTLTLASDAFSENSSQVSSPYVITRHHAERARHRHHTAPVSPNALHPHCFVGHYGGAVYNHGLLTVTSSNFDSNVLQNSFQPGCTYGYGGAIYNDDYGTMSVTGSAFTSNSAVYGGAIYNNSNYGSATFANDTFSGNTGCTASTGCPVAGCSGAGCTSYADGYGAAIYDNNGPGIVVTNSSFSNNIAGGPVSSATGEGGALNLETGAPSITNSTFTNNLAGGGTTNCSWGEGGAIYEDAGNTLELDNDTFTGNVAGGDRFAYGGAIYNENELDHGSGNTFSGNSATAPGTAACYTGHASNSSYLGQAYGGAIYADYGISMTGSTFSNNVATCNYYCQSGALYIDDPSILSGDTFTSNSVTASCGNSSPNCFASAGAIDVEDTTRLSTSTFTTNGVTANAANAFEAYGGAIYADSTLTSTANVFTSNSASAPAGTSAYAYGGAVYTNSTYGSNGDIFKNNSVSGIYDVYGGAAYIDSTWGMTNATFVSNVAGSTNGSAYGGALDIETAGTLANSTLTGNAAGANGQSGYGGAIYDDAASTLNGVKVTGNVATTSGGGLYSETSIDTVNSSIFSGNSVTQAKGYDGGGGIYGDYGNVITNSTISGNGVAVQGNYAGGGGYYNNDTGTVVTGTTISGNNMTGIGTHVGGGGIFNYDDGTFANDTISGNTSGGDGGGFEEYGSYHVLLNNDTFYQNSASGNGGNIFNDNNTSPYVTLANTIVAGGTAAATGPDIDNTGTMTSNDYNVIGSAVAGGGTFAAGLHDKLSTDPLLLALSNNGGPTFTRADQSTSPGTGYIPWTSAGGGTCGNVTGMAVDQRGFTRGAGGKCDVGAYEFAGVASALRMHVTGFHGREKHRQPRHRPPAIHTP